MNLHDVDALAEVIEQALGLHRERLEARIDERVSACIDVERATELAREAAGAAEGRLLDVLQQRSREAVTDVVADAVDSARQILEVMIDSRVKACVDADRAVELAREAVSDTEDRLHEILQQRTSEAVTAMRDAAAESLARSQDLLLRRLELADRLTQDVQELRRALEDLTPKDGTDGASAYELARDGGFGGSQADWLASLHGRSASAADVASTLAEMSSFRQLVRGEDGAPGAGIAAPLWAPGIHRQGVIVQAYFGQYFRALKDTSAEPYASADWERVGCAGFHLAEPWAEGRTYQPGDLFVRDFGLFAWTEDGAQLLVGRGRPGDRGLKGDKGKDGADGRDGRDGAAFQTFELQGTMLAVVMRNIDGGLHAATVDLLPVFETLGEAIEERLFKRLVTHFGGGAS
jgi:hypothetical protein